MTDNLKTWPEKIYFPDIDHKLYCGHVNGAESKLEIEYVRADLIRKTALQILDELRVKEEKGHYFALAIPLRIAKEREKKLITELYVTAIRLTYGGDEALKAKDELNDPEIIAGIYREAGLEELK